MHCRSLSWLTLDSRQQEFLSDRAALLCPRLLTEVLRLGSTDQHGVPWTWYMDGHGWTFRHFSPFPGKRRQKHLLCCAIQRSGVLAPQSRRRPWKARMGKWCKPSSTDESNVLRELHVPGTTNNSRYSCLELCRRGPLLKWIDMNPCISWNECLCASYRFTWSRVGHDH